MKLRFFNKWNFKAKIGPGPSDQDADDGIAAVANAVADGVLYSVP